MIAMDPAQLEHYGRALSGTPFSLPAEGRILQPSRRVTAGLRRLHARICRLAETKPKIVSHFEVARAIEQGLIQMLVTCLTTASARADGHVKRRHARIMVRFEEVLAEHISRPLRMPELCALVAVSDRTLRLCCAKFLGMSPTQYVLASDEGSPPRAARRQTPHGKRRRSRPPLRLRGAGANAIPGSVNFPNFCIVDDEINGLVSPRWASLPAEISQLGKSSARLHKEEKVKQLYLLGISLLAVSACVPQVPQPAAPPLAATGLAAGSPTNTTTAFDGYYGHAVARGVSPGCPDFVTGRDLTIRNGLATFQAEAPATGTGIPATGTLNFQGYVNPQGGLAMVSQTGGQTFQGQIDPNFVLTGRAAGPNCLYDASWNRIRGL